MIPAWWSLKAIYQPEPSTGVIKFPGGFVEVSRCSDGQYYAHICADDESIITESRIDYDYDGYLKNGIPSIPDNDKIKKLAIKVTGTYKTYE